MPSGPNPTQRKGVWEPLPLIVYGYAIHPLSPSRRDTRYSNRTRLSTVTEVSNDDHLVHRDVVSLEVGDEVYAFEKFTPKAKEVEGIWYRGYAFIFAFVLTIYLMQDKPLAMLFVQPEGHR